MHSELPTRKPSTTTGRNNGCKSSLKRISSPSRRLSANRSEVCRYLKKRATAVSVLEGTTQQGHAAMIRPLRRCGRGKTFQHVLPYRAGVGGPAGGSALVAAGGGTLGSITMVLSSLITGFCSVALRSSAWKRRSPG